MNKVRTVITILMVLTGIMFLLPIIIMVLTSFKTEREVLDPSSILPHHFSLSNYHQVVKSAAEAPVALWGVNSLFISSFVTLLVVMMSASAAFAITRIRVKRGEMLMNIFIGAMLVPTQLFLVPLYMILGRLHLLDTPYALIFPASAGGFGVFMICQFMRGLPPALEEAALIDGCTWLQVFWRVTLPLCGPALATLAVFTFIGSWNDYISPLVFMEKVTNYTLPVGIALFQSSYSTQYGLTLATSLLATLPLLLIFIVFQRQIIESMSSSGLKE